MKDNPVIAVFIPSYNHARFLPSLFQSLLDQTYTNLHIYFQDDASTDNSCEVADEWLPKLEEKFARVSSAYRRENAGDKGWTTIRDLTERITDADYIQCCESDDYFMPDKFEKQIKYLRDNPRYNAVHTDVEAHYENGEVCPAFWAKYRCTQTPAAPFIPTGNIRKQLEHCNFIYTCTMLVESKLYKKHFTHDKFQYELDTGFGDYPFFLSLSKEALIGYIDEPLSVYRVLGNSLSHQDRPWVIEKTERIKNLAAEGLI